MSLSAHGRSVIVAALFSARVKDHGAVVDELAERIETAGGNVVARHVQRRGVSGGKPGRPRWGGRATMHLPFSRRTLFTAGKARELAELARAHAANLIVFHNELTAHQVAVLAELTGCEIADRRALAEP